LCCGDLKIVVRLEGKSKWFYSPPWLNTLKTFRFEARLDEKSVKRGAMIILEKAVDSE